MQGIKIEPANDEATFLLKPGSRFSHQQIYLRFTFLIGKHLRYYTGLVIPVEFWDKERERAKQDRKFPTYSEINIRLNQIESEANEIAHRARLNKVNLSPEVFKNELDIFLGKRVETDDHQTFRKYFLNFIEERAANPNYSKGSIQVYRTTFKRLLEYSDLVIRKELGFADFNHAFFSDFSNHLFGKDFGNNYVNKLTSTLKTVLKEADKREVSPELKIRDGWIIAKREEPPAIYLNEEELFCLSNLDLSDNPRLGRVRDLFLIGCNTGLRFSDFTEIKPGNFKKTADGKEYIEMITQKTGMKVTIPIKSDLRQILLRYGYQPPETISNQKFNEYLKELGKLAGIDEPTVMSSFRNGKRLDETFAKYELITTHTARRSFATNAYKSTVPIKYIMTVTGHTTEKEFYKYIRIRPDEHALLVSDNPFFK